MTGAHVGVATIEFVGELTIKTVAQARDRLIEFLDGATEVQADVAAVATVDLTFIQLIQSARRTARKTGVAFRLAAPAAGALREILERGGFLAASEDREFWLMQGEGG